MMASFFNAVGIIANLLALLIKCFYVFRNFETFPRSSGHITQKGEFRNLRYIRALQALPVAAGGVEIGRPLAKEIVEDSVQLILKHYLDKRYRKDISPVGGLLLVSLVFIFFANLFQAYQNHVATPILAKMGLGFSVRIFLMLGAVLAGVAVLNLLTDSQSLPGIRAGWLRMRSRIEETPLGKINGLISSEQEYLFLDARFCEDSGTGTFDLRIQLLDKRVLPFGMFGVGPAKSECRQPRKEHYSEKVLEVVRRYVERNFMNSKTLPCVFVVSPYGVTSAEVTKALCECGLNAYNIGKIEGRPVLLKKKIEELSLLRQCGII